MKRELDFAPAASPGKRMIAALCLVALGAAAATYLAIDSRLRNATTRSSILLATKPVVASELPRALTVVATAPYMESAATLLTERFGAWPQVLTTLEAVPPNGISLQGVEVNPCARVVRVELTFAAYERLFDYLKGLSAGEPEIEWELTQVQPLTQGRWTAIISARDARTRPRF